MAGDNPIQWKNPVVRWVEYRMPVFTLLNNAVGTNYPRPRTLTTGGTSDRWPVWRW